MMAWTRSVAACLALCLAVHPCAAQTQAPAIEISDNVRTHIAELTKSVTSLRWPEGQKASMTGYIERAGQAAPQLLGVLRCPGERPIQLLFVEDRPRNRAGWTRRDGADVHLVVNQLFFDLLDKQFASVGPSGGNYTFWYFIHELTHAAEYRYAQRYGVTLDAAGVTKPASAAPPLYAVLDKSLRTVVADLKARGIDLAQAISKPSSEQAKSARPIVQKYNLPTLYALQSPREAFAELVATRALAKDFPVSPEVTAAIDDYFARLRCRR